MDFNLCRFIVVLLIFGLFEVELKFGMICGKVFKNCLVFIVLDRVKLLELIFVIGLFEFRFEFMMCELVIVIVFCCVLLLVLVFCVSVIVLKLNLVKLVRIVVCMR